MECVKCRKNIEPLELYTGDIACPRCKSKLNLIPKHITAQNPRARDLLSLSELYYHYTLCKNAKITATDLVNYCTLTPNEMIEKAIAYCQEAMQLGHPEAIWRMAFFYHKNYVRGTATDSVRLRTAAQLYLGLVTAPDAVFEGYDTDEVESRTLLLKRRAADDMFAMLRSMPKRDRQIYGAKLIEHGYLTQEAAQSLSAQAEKTGADELIDVLNRATSKVRAPLFGIVRIKKEQLEGILDTIVQSPVIKNRKMDLMFIPLNRDDVYDFRNSIGGKSLFHEMRTTADDIRRGAAMAIEKAEDNCCVYFFNKAGKHRYYGSASKKQRVQKGISTDAIDKLISSTPDSSYVFFDDDLYQKNEKIEKIIAEISASLEV